MARLFVVVGYPDTSPSSRPFSVYVGDNGDEKRAAMEASTAARFVVLDNPIGLRKNNPRAAANFSAVLASASTGVVPGADSAPAPARSGSRRK